MSSDNKIGLGTKVIIGVILFLMFFGLAMCSEKFKSKEGVDAVVEDIQRGIKSSAEE